ncbi:MAG TPA: PfkB family carbohydrate kinase [Bauldia sp.]|nr:PfkB family carbohydrate kinase [Bauldia sp.]
MAEVVVAAVGDNCIDRYLALGKSTVGGNAVNVAVHLARLGLSSAYLGAVGDDEDGRRILYALRSNGVDTRHVHIRAGRTAYTDIAVGAGGERIFAAEEMGVCAGYRPDPAEMAMLRELRHVHIGWLDDGGLLKQVLAAKGTSVSQDLSVASPAAGRRVNGLAIAFASAGPGLADGEALATRLVTEGARTAVVTCGSAGSVATDGATVVRTGAHPVEVVDTLGAGDTFIAGFLAARLRGENLAASLEAGRDLAAITCTHLGGFPQTPLMLA